MNAFRGTRVEKVVGKRSSLVEGGRAVSAVPAVDIEECILHVAWQLPTRSSRHPPSPTDSSKWTTGAIFKYRSVFLIGHISRIPRWKYSI